MELSSSEKHAVWKTFNEEISRQGITTGADKWDVLVSIWALDEALEASEVEAVANERELAETLDGKSALEARAAGIEVFASAKSELKAIMPKASRETIGDSAHALLVGLLQQKRDQVFRPLPPPVVEEPIEDLPAEPIGAVKKG